MNAKEIVITKLEALDVCLHDDDTGEYTVRCPYCGDSVKHPEHGHLGIQIALDDPTMPMLWNCFRCGEGGIVDVQLLDDLGLYLEDSELNEIKNFDRKTKRIAGMKRNKTHMNRYKVPGDCSNPHHLEKLHYVQERIGQSINAVPNKIIMSFVDFLAFNEIDPSRIPKLNPTILSALDKEYVGFLSANNNCITFRKITKSRKGHRYYKVILNPYLNDDASFFSIPTMVNLLYTEPLTVHIAEGTMDILSIKHNLLPDQPNSVFYAACGYSYINIIRYMTRLGLCTDLHLHVYADRDKTDEEHIDMIQTTPLSAFVSHLYLHRNGIEGEKDYGVPMDRIRDTHRKLW